MRLFFLLSLALLVTIVSAWTKEDHEIFDLVSDLEAAEGKGTTFYSWLDVPSTASTAEIARAYRKKSVQLHPDKNHGVKNAHERFARLGVISKILRDGEGRKRYDFFYKNGVPKWRGTGYYYSRFRPGLGTVFVFLTILTSGLQYLIQNLNYKRDLRRVEWIQEQARTAAWGKGDVSVEEQRKVKVNLGGGPRIDDDGNIVGGRMVNMVVKGMSVSMLEPDGMLIPVDSSSVTAPSIKRTWFLSLVMGFVLKIKGGNSPVDTPEENGELEDDGSTSASDVPGSGTVTPSEGSAPSLKGGRVPTTMAGGRRRKAVRKR